MNNCDAGVRIGDTLYSSMAYADDITLFSTNVQDLQNLIDICVAYSKRWRFKFGVEKSKCMIVGKWTQSGGLVTNVYVMKNRLIYLVTYLIVVVIMPAMSPID